MFLKELLSISVAASFARLGTFIIVPILVQRWDDAQLGQYDIYWSMLLFFEIVFSLKLPDALFRYVLKDNDARAALLCTTLLLLVAMSFIGSCITLLVFHLNDQLNAIATLVCIIASTRVIIFSLQEFERAVGNFFNHSLIAILLGISYVLNILYLDFTAKLTIGNVFLGVLVSNGIVCFYAIYSVKIQVLIPQIKHIRQLLYFGGTLLPSTISWWLVRYASRWVVGATAGVVAVAFVTKTSYVALVFSAATTILLQTFQRRIFSEVDENTDTLSIEYQRYLTIMMTCTVFYLLCITLIFYFIDISEQYLSTIVTLVFANWFLSLSAFYGQIYTAKLQIFRASLSAIIGAVVTITSMFYITNWFTHHLYSLGVIFGAVFMFLHRSIDLRRDIKWSVKQYEYINTLLVCTVIPICWIIASPERYFAVFIILGLIFLVVNIWRRRETA